MATADAGPTAATTDVLDPESGDAVPVGAADPGADRSALGRGHVPHDLYWTGKRWLACPRIDASDDEWYAFANADRGEAVTYVIELSERERDLLYVAAGSRREARLAESYDDEVPSAVRRQARRIAEEYEALQARLVAARMVEE